MHAANTRALDGKLRLDDPHYECGHVTERYETYRHGIGRGPSPCAFVCRHRFGVQRGHGLGISRRRHCGGFRRVVWDVIFGLNANPSFESHRIAALATNNFTAQLVQVTGLGRADQEAPQPTPQAATTSAKRLW